MKRLYNEGEARMMRDALEAAGVPYDSQGEAMRRCAIITRLLRAEIGCVELGYRRDQIIARFILHIEATYGQPLTRATLYNWKRAYFRAGQSVIGLVDRRACRRKATRRRGGHRGGIEGSS
jgi:hypothetical protein